MPCHMVRDEVLPLGALMQEAGEAKKLRASVTAC